jgi:hypothetical protein
MYIEIHTEHITESGTIKETKGGRNKGKMRANSNEVHCICVGTRQKETL